MFVANQSVQSNTDQPVGGAISAFGAVNITGTVFSHNIAELGSAIFFWSEEGTVSDSLNDGGADTFFDAKTVTNLSTGPANLSALGYWGGPTQTFLPLPGSAAICGGTQPLLNGTALTTDQRGVGISGTRYGQGSLLRHRRGANRVRARLHAVAGECLTRQRDFAPAHRYGHRGRRGPDRRLGQRDGVGCGGNA